MKNDLTILITGGAGFIGINFVNYWSNKYKNHKLVILDKITYSSNEKYLNKFVRLNKKIVFIKGDICNTKLVNKIFEKYKINILVNFAAETHVDHSIKNPKKFIKSNIHGTFNLLECARKYWNKNLIVKNHFHHISTDEIFGSLNIKGKPFSEKSPYDPSSPYSASKLASDMIVNSYFKTYGMNTTISNTSNNFGPFIDKSKLIPKIITNILLNKKIPIYGNGKQIRDWIYVDDHIKGIEKILIKGKYGESYNLGSDNQISNLELAKIICIKIDQIFKNKPLLRKKYPKALFAKNLQSSSLIEFVEDRKGHDFRYAINFSKAKKHLNYNPKSKFNDTIEKTIKWFIENDKYWK